ncbi:MAG: transketolase [Candidatus Gastranaerophilales bacterium]|nr:transketolase [Candidatus Gastranaerophilales bacterium]
MNKDEIKQIQELCRQNRCNIIKMIHCAKSGHPGGGLSAVEILTVLYQKVMKNFPQWTKSTQHNERDRFVLSKGHASAALYSVLAQRGYFPEEELMSFRKLHSRLQGHPCCRTLPGIEVSTGSLGQGLSMACGIAMALKLDKNPAHVFTLLGDGELQEGNCWEALMTASHRNLNNLTAIIDRNNLQIDGTTDKIKNLNPLDKKLEAFNWNVIKIDGHNIEEIYEALEKSKKSDKPTAIIANTVKGKGISFMENECGWHGKAPCDEDCQRALEEVKNK